MIKIYQTIIDKGHGNCMQAAIASLLELSLESVPNFISLGHDWFKTYYQFLLKHGYEYQGSLYNNNQYRIINKRKGISSAKLRTKFYRLKQMEGVKGYFYASVYSPKYYNTNDKPPVTHAVIIDKKLNIMHDVNPENINLKKYPEYNKIKFNGILDVHMINPISK